MSQAPGNPTSGDSTPPLSHADPQAGAKPRPDRLAGIVKIIGGLLLIAAGLYFFDLHVERSNAPGAADGVITGLAIGGGLWLLTAGIANLRGSYLPRLVGVAALVLCSVALALAEPRVWNSRKIAAEQGAWERLQASPKAYSDYQTYELWTREPRAGVRAARSLARAQYEVARLAPMKTRRVETLRNLIRDFRAESRDHPAEDFKPAIELARQELSKIYAAAFDELGAAARPAAATNPPATAKTATPEFAENPEMKAAFRAILAQLARADDDVVYLVFSSDTSQLAAPAAASSSSDTTADPAAKLIDPGEAFSPDREDRRESAFIRAMEESLKSAFAEPLVRLRQLAPDADRAGKVIFHVDCKARRADGGFTLTRDGKQIGTLFKVEVAWEFSAFDATGRRLAFQRSRSSPAENMQFRRTRSDPDRAAYAVMMDSAYYNYCRQITGQLGLTPAPVREYFTFER